MIYLGRLSPLRENLAKGSGSGGDEKNKSERKKGNGRKKGGGKVGGGRKYVVLGCRLHPGRWWMKALQNNREFPKTRRSDHATGV